MSEKKTIKLYDKRKAQGKYYYQLNGKSAEENYIEILKERQQERKQQRNIESQIEKIIADEITEEIIKAFSLK